MCHKEMEHSALKEQKDILLQTKINIIAVGQKVLKEENIAADSLILNDADSVYYNNAEQYILDKFTFYECFKVRRLSLSLLVY